MVYILKMVGFLSGTVAYDLRVQLSEPGFEYFKAIVTPTPLTLSPIDAQLLADGMTSTNSTAFVDRLSRGVGGIVNDAKPTEWGTGDLRVKVK